MATFDSAARCMTLSADAELAVSSPSLTTKMARRSISFVKVPHPSDNASYKIVMFPPGTTCRRVARLPSSAENAGLRRSTLLNVPT
jgi:hypothetical protein